MNMLREADEVGDIWASAAWRQPGRPLEREGIRGLNNQMRNKKGPVDRNRRGLLYGDRRSGDGRSLAAADSWIVQPPLFSIC